MPAREIQVLYSGLVQETLGLNRERLSLAEDATVLDVLRSVAQRHPALGDSLFVGEGAGLVPNLIVLADGRDIRQRQGESTAAGSQVEIILLPPSTGGG